MHRINFNVPDKNVPEGWWDVLDNPRPVTLETLKTGTVVINKRGTLNPNHRRTKNIQSEDLEVPILAYIVHHREFGDYLLDAGLDASYQQDPRGGVDDPRADEFNLGKNQNIGYYIHKKKIKLNGVFLSHLHSDHIAGVRELPENIPYVVGKGEWDEFQTEVNRSLLEGIDTLYEIDFSKLDEIAPLGHCANLFGDGSLWAIWTPGHTPGHMSFLVNSQKEPIFLTMDAAFINENLECEVAPSDYTWNLEMAQESLERIVKFLDMYDQVSVRVGHE